MIGGVTGRTCPTCSAVSPAGERFCPHDGTVLADEDKGPNRLVGTTIAGKYRVEGFLKDGGMGTVYRANHLMLGRMVALKVVRPQLTPDVATLRRFQREARAAAALKHPNIVDVYDLGESEDGTLYIAMELVDGIDLKAIIGDSGPLPSERVVRLVTQLGRALAMAHGNGVVHRDIKPQNIMIGTDAEGNDRVTLLDFGIAEARRVDGGTELTAAGTVLGTPQYMSPEQARGSQEIDGRSDIYSLGVVMYEMLAGVVPFDDKSAVQLLVKHVQQPPPPISARNPDVLVPGGLERIVLRCLAKDPGERFQSGTELVAALDRYISGDELFPEPLAAPQLPAVPELELEGPGGTVGIELDTVLVTPPPAAADSAASSDVTAMPTAELPVGDDDFITEPTAVMATEPVTAATEQVASSASTTVMPAAATPVEERDEETAHTRPDGRSSRPRPAGRTGRPRRRQKDKQKGEVAADAARKVAAVGGTALRRVARLTLAGLSRVVRSRRGRWGAVAVVLAGGLFALVRAAPQAGGGQTIADRFRNALATDASDVLALLRFEPVAGVIALAMVLTWAVLALRGFPPVFRTRKLKLVDSGRMVATILGEVGIAAVLWYVAKRMFDGGWWTNAVLLAHRPIDIALWTLCGVLVVGAFSSRLGVPFLRALALAGLWLGVVAVGAFLIWVFAVPPLVLLI